MQSSSSSSQNTRIAADEESLIYCILSYYFPPDTSAAAVRAYGLARALTDAGNEVHVFTHTSAPSASERYHVHVVPGREPGEGMKTALGLAPGESLYNSRRGLPSRAIRRLARYGREWFLFPDAMRSWSKKCAAAAASWLADNRCDILISTALPASTHMAALRARGREPGPIWIEDWQDLLVANPHYPFGRIRRWRDRRLERVLIAGADAVTVVTEEMGRSLAEAYPHVRIVPVYIGYDERTLAEGRRCPRDGARLTFTYTGYLYEGRRSARPLLASVSTLITEGSVDRSRICLQFVGPPDAALQGAVEELGLGDVVRLRGVVPRSAIPEILEESDVLLVIMWDSAQEASLIPAKTFEYMAAQRPILALNCAPSSELGRLLTRTHTGTCLDGEEGIGAAVLALYRRFVSEGPPSWDGDREALADYTHARAAEEFDTLARSLLASVVKDG